MRNMLCWMLSVFILVTLSQEVTVNSFPAGEAKKIKRRVYVVCFAILIQNLLAVQVRMHPTPCFQKNRGMPTLVLFNTRVGAKLVPIHLVRRSPLFIIALSQILIMNWKWQKAWQFLTFIPNNHSLKRWEKIDRVAPYMFTLLSVN
jgi:hypothetical protein